jgi:hypothetical protein
MGHGKPKAPGRETEGEEAVDGADDDGGVSVAEAAVASVAGFSFSPCKLICDPSSFASLLRA